MRSLARVTAAVLTVVATGATAGAVHGTVKSAGPSPIYKGFVDRCLRERGYEVIAWQ